MADHPVSELTLSRIWQDGLYTREMRTADGRRLSVIYGGVWTHQNGPDFRDAMLEIDGRLVRGAVELHLRSSDWDRHGHQHNPAYDDVILHVVAENDTRRGAHGPSGNPVPTVVLTDYLTRPLQDLAEQMFVTALGSLGSQSCLPTLAGGRPDAIRDVLRRSGWKRMTARQLRFNQDLERMPPGEALYLGLLDGMGLIQNRDGMAALGATLPLGSLEATADGTGVGVLALLLGAGGFLPLSPMHAELADVSKQQVQEIEYRAETLLTAFCVEPLLQSVWTLNRVRPQNHPVRRLASFSSLIELSRKHGLLSTMLALPLDGGRSWRTWLASARPAIGRARIDQITVNILAPFIAAYADVTGDESLAERISELWEVLPGSADDSIAKGTLTQIVGTQHFKVNLAIESQGLHEIGRNGCRQLRCFECPIAALAVMHEADGERGL